MKVLIFGGTGRISKEVVEFLLESQNDVYCLTRGNESRKIFVDDRAKMIQADIRNKEYCIKLLDGVFFDVVIDFISYTADNLKNKLEIVKDNFIQYIFISSATVYEPGNYVHTEFNSKLSNVGLDYSKNKILAEQYLEQYFRTSDKYYTIVRPYVTYGNTRIPYPIVPIDNMREYSLVKRLLNGEKIPLLNINNKVTLTHSKDFARGLCGLLMNEKAFNEAFHITSDKSYSWEEVLDTCGRILGHSILKVNCEVDELLRVMPEYREILVFDKANNWMFDNSKIKLVVPDFICRIELEEGLKEMLEFYSKTSENFLRDEIFETKLDIFLDSIS